MINRFRRKFKRAFAGAREVLWPEFTIKVGFVIGLIVIILAFIFGLNRFEFLAILTTIVIVIILEGLNTVLERVIDLVEPRYHESVRQFKDALAGLIILAIILAAIVGITIFWPYL